MVANIGITHPDYVLIKKATDLPSQGKEDGEVTAEDLLAVGSAGEADSAPVANGSGSSEVPVESGGEVVTPQPVVGVETSGEGTEGEGPGEEGHDRNNEVVKSNEKDEDERSATEDLLQPTMQALAVLSNASAPETIFTCCYGTDPLPILSVDRCWLTSLTACLEVRKRTR